MSFAISCTKNWKNFSHKLDSIHKKKVFLEDEFLDFFFATTWKIIFLCGKFSLIRKTWAPVCIDLQKIAPYSLLQSPPPLQSCSPNPSQVGGALLWDSEKGIMLVRQWERKNSLKRESCGASGQLRLSWERLTQKEMFISTLLCFTKIII
jgi:hypothetical protein